MSVAENAAQLSYAKRAQVGAVAVKDRNILSFGYNGTLPGADNNCEDENGMTKKDVIHAEENLLMKLAKSTSSASGCDVYVTLSPCITCARMMANAEVRRVFYRDAYRDDSGIELLKSNGVEVIRI